MYTFRDDHETPTMTCWLLHAERGGFQICSHPISMMRCDYDSLG